MSGKLKAPTWGIALTLALVSSGTGLWLSIGTHTEKAEPARLVRPSQLFADVITRSWSNQAVLGSDALNSASTVATTPNLNFEMTRIEGDGLIGPLAVELLSEPDFIDAKRPLLMEPRWQAPGFLGSDGPHFTPSVSVSNLGGSVERRRERKP